MTADVIAMRRESDSIADRRADAIRRHPATVSKQCPPHAALLHRIASLITTNDLPPAHVSVHGGDVLVDLSASELVENGVRRWAAALDLVVTTIPADVNGGAGTLWSGSGWDGTNTWWHIAGAQPVPVPA